MEIRQLTLDDSGVLVEVFSAVLPEFPERLVDGAPASFLADPTSFAFGAWDATEPAGLAWGVQMRDPTGRLITYLHQLDVREQFRRRGVGSRLVAHRPLKQREILRSLASCTAGFTGAVSQRGPGREGRRCPVSTFSSCGGACGPRRWRTAARRGA